MKIYNTASKEVEQFEPHEKGVVKMYACGPTVYDYTHIGHLRKYVSDDILKRTLTFFGKTVTHVMNITDVGHLESDSDEGEDKLEKGAKKYDMSIDEVVKKFTEHFKQSLNAVNITDPDNMPKATDHIQEMIDLIKQLEKKGYAYETDEAVYFDTSKYSDYGSFSGQKLEDKKEQARDNVHVDPNKKQQTDFALWFKRVGRHKDHAMHWNSPWGDGFPGWHIECSAMSMKYLGEEFDIHTGGIDHIPVHHENEIAQSRCATNAKFARYWFHSAFLKVDGTKMSKSLENLYTIEDITDRGIDPLALRYLFLQTHYRQELNFTWESLKGAESALNKLRQAVVQLRSQSQRSHLSDEKLKKAQALSGQFTEHIANDLHTPQALALVWEVTKSNIPSEDKLDLLYSWDQIFGFDLAEYQPPNAEIPTNVQKLAENRQTARANKNFEKADQIRTEIEKHGYVVEDVGETYRIKKA